MSKRLFLPVTALLLFFSGTIYFRFKSILGFGIPENLCSEIERELSTSCADVDKLGYLLSTWPAWLGSVLASAFFTTLILMFLVNMGFGLPEEAEPKDH